MWTKNTKKKYNRTSSDRMDKLNRIDTVGGELKSYLLVLLSYRFYIYLFIFLFKILPSVIITVI